MEKRLWCRLYAEFAHDPKVQLMSETFQRRFIMLLCVSCNNNLFHATDFDVSFLLHIDINETKITKELFIKKKFIDENWQVLNWNKRQFISDNSTVRVRKHRVSKKSDKNTKVKRYRNVTETLQKRSKDVAETFQNRFKTVTVTAPDTDTDTDTDTYTYLLKEQKAIVDNFSENGNSRYTKINSIHAWRFTDLHLDKLLHRVEMQNTTNRSSKQIHEEIAYHVFILSPLNKKTKDFPVMKSINSALKLLKTGRWNVPSGCYDQNNVVTLKDHSMDNA